MARRTKAKPILYNKTIENFMIRLYKSDKYLPYSYLRVLECIVEFWPSNCTVLAKRLVKCKVFKTKQTAQNAISKLKKLGVIKAKKRTSIVKITIK